MRLDESSALARFGEARVARLATITESGQAHLVPITFSIDERCVYTMVDHKPKRSNSLKRLANISAHPAVSILVDHYDDEWTRLWWVRLDGSAAVESSGQEWDAARRLLADKYPQYRNQPPEGPAIAISIENVVWWEWSNTP